MTTNRGEAPTAADPARPVPAGLDPSTGPAPPAAAMPVVESSTVAANRRWRPGLPNAVRGLPGPFWWLWLGTLVNRAGTFIEPFFVLYLTGPRHIDVRTAGLVLLVWGLGSTLSQPIGGFCADRFGRRVTLAVALLASAAMLLTLSVVRGLPEIMAAVFVLGLVADTYRPAVSAAVTDLVPEPQRLRAFALQFWAINLGFSVAAVSAGLLLHSVGFGLLFVLDACTTLAFGLLTLRFVPETRPDPAAAAEPAPRFTDSYRLLVRDRLLGAATLLVLAYAVLYGQVNLVLPLAVRDAGFSTSVYGYAIAINGVLIVLGQPLTVSWIERTSRRVTLPLGMTLVGVGVASTGLCHSPPAFAGSVVVWTVGEIFTAGSFQALIATMAPAGARGRYNGAIGLAWGASGMLGPLFGAGLYGWSRPVLWISCLVLGAGAGFGLRVLIGRIDARAAASAAPIVS